MLLLLRLLEHVNVNQSDCQFGFTKNLNPLMSSVICSEAIVEAKMSGKPLYLVTIDTRKAFDVVNHVILKKNIFEEGVKMDLWNIVDQLYTDMTSKVKWHGGLSDSFQIDQGVRQGGILSTHFYKLYVDPLLHDLKEQALGSFIGATYVGALAVADDFLFMSNSADKLQLMLNLKHMYSGERRYSIHPIKTVLVPRVVTQSSKKQDKDRAFYVGESEISACDSSEHLGLIRSTKDENGMNIKKKISLARRTLYSLVKTGVHGSNGLNPKTSYKIYLVYVIPRLLNGLEVLPINTTQIRQLTAFHLDTLRNIQSLPKRTATCIVYLLLGALPIEAELEKRQVNLMYSVSRSDNPTLQELRKRQDVVQFPESFFIRVAHIIEKYNLPTPDEMNRFSKEQCKHRVKCAVRTYWTQELVERAADKSTLERCHLPSLQIGHTNPVWDSVQSDRIDVMRANVKGRMLTGTYLLQSHKNKFNIDCAVEATCPLCCLEDEDIDHMLLRCPALRCVRNQYLAELKGCLQQHLGVHIWSENFRDRNVMLQLILDCTKLVPKILPDKRDFLLRIETHTRLLCYKLHLKRLYLHKNIKADSGNNMAANPSC